MKKLDDASDAAGPSIDPLGNFQPADELSQQAAREIRTLVSLARHGWLEVKERILVDRRVRGDHTLHAMFMQQAENILAGLETDL